MNVFGLRSLEAWGLVIIGKSVYAETYVDSCCSDNNGRQE